MLSREFGYSQSQRKSPIVSGLKVAAIVGCAWAMILAVLVLIIKAQTLYFVPLLQTGWVIVSLLGGYGAGLKAEKLGWFYGGATGLLIGLLCGLVVLATVPGWVKLSVFLSMNLMSLAMGLLAGSIGINHQHWLRQRGRRFM